MSLSVTEAWRARQAAQDKLEDAVARAFYKGMRVRWQTRRLENTYNHLGEVVDVAGERVKVRNLETEIEQWLNAMTLTASL